MAIKQIDFHLDKHTIQVRDGELFLFVDGNTRKKPIKLDAGEIMRILRVSGQDAVGVVNPLCL